MSRLKLKNSFSGAALAVVLLASCTKNPNTPGVEYMPDMYRSPAIEAYVDYGMDPYLVGEEKAASQRSTQSARKPVAGTIANFGDDSPELYMPYPYPNTVEGYEKAGVELKVPIPFSKDNYDKGLALFNRFCIHCHGEKGEGNGSMTETAGGKYPIVPSYQSRADLPFGKMYHSIMYGKGLMGSHASQLSPQERWQVILFVKSLMKGDPKFDEKGNITAFGDEVVSASAPAAMDNAQVTQN